MVLEEQEEHSGSHREESTTSVDENTKITINTNTTTAITASETKKSSEIQSCNTATTENQLQNVAASTNSKNFQKISATAAQHSEENRDLANSLPSIKTVPISLKGDFFSDSFFEDIKKQFTTAVQDVIQQPDAACSLSDEITTYRSQLQKNRRLENQEVHVEEDTRSFKVRNNNDLFHLSFLILNFFLLTIDIFFLFFWTMIRMLS